MCSVPFMNQKAPRRHSRSLFQVLLSPSFQCCTKVEIIEKYLDSSPAAHKLKYIVCMYVSVSFLFHLLNILGRRSVTFSGKSQKTPYEDERMNLEGPDREKAIKFERVYLLTNRTLLLYTVYQQLC